MGVYGITHNQSMELAALPLIQCGITALLAAGVLEELEISVVSLKLLAAATAGVSIVLFGGAVLVWACPKGRRTATVLMALSLLTASLVIALTTTASCNELDIFVVRITAAALGLAAAGVVRTL